jgi:hypothetical protein
VVSGQWSVFSNQLKILLFMVLFCFRCKIAGKHAELVVKAFGEIGGAVEADDVGDLTDLVFAAA